MTSDASDWAAQRRDAAAEHAAAAERSRAAESEQGRLLVAGFVREALARGIPSGPLRARAYSGGATYRTPVQGWYVRRNRSLGVGTDSRFYVLNVPTSLRARLRGTDLAPEDPPLVVGRGGRDGESIGLDELLAKRLEAGADFP